MLFNSFEFIFLFLPITLLGFFAINYLGHRRLAIGWMVLASFIFYGRWNPKYVWLIAGSILFNYLIGVMLGRQYQIDINQRGNRRISSWILALGITGDLALLGYYKYANFFVSNVDALLGTNAALGTIILPLGISFFTFVQIAYLVDAYRGETHEYNFLDYCLFVTYFPHLIAGPILHHKEMMPQFQNKKATQFSFENLTVGITIFLLGLFKKTVVADGIANFANPVFDYVDAGHTLSFFEAWGGALAYTLQLYFDFSGYCDMAIGISKMFGILLPLNFNSPYKADSVIDFWRRWHMTLSRFLKDYLYIPLGGNRKGEVRRYINLMITMLLGGLWHGASWTFVIWGGLHGIYLTINHLWRSIKKALGYHPSKVTRWEVIYSRLLTFLAVVVAWVFFRANSLSGAASIINSMAGLNGVSLFKKLGKELGALKSIGITFEGLSPNEIFPTIGLLWITVLLIFVWIAPNTQEVLAMYKPALGWEKLNQPSRIFLWRPNMFWSISISVIALTSLFAMLSVKSSQFLYFQF